MSVKCFVDTNLFVYARDAGETRKQPVAARCLEELWRTRTGRTSMQVLTEYYVTVTRKLKPGMDRETAWDDMTALLSWMPQAVDRETLVRAHETEGRYRTSWWDSMIVAAARLQGCQVLLSEDFQDGMIFFGQLQVRNPFKSSVDEPYVDYPASAKPISRHRARGRPRTHGRAT